MWIALAWIISFNRHVKFYAIANAYAGIYFKIDTWSDTQVHTSKTDPP